MLSIGGKRGALPAAGAFCCGACPTAIAITPKPTTAQSTSRGFILPPSTRLHGREPHALHEPEQPRSAHGYGTRDRKTSCPCYVVPAGCRPPREQRHDRRAH